MRTTEPCPNCSGGTLYARSVDGAGGTFQLLPGLGSFLSYAKLQVVICGDCGLIRLFADESATAKLAHADDWQRLQRTPR
jgi:hypothetical protein